jgi:RNA polymerase sigma factor (sigma-70 family)
MRHLCYDNAVGISSPTLYSSVRKRWLERQSANILNSSRPLFELDEPTSSLIERIRSGDALAREQLFRKYLPILRRWAKGRIPQHARDISDTDDMVQITLMRAMARINDIRAARPGAFLSYLHNVLLNYIRDELRKHSRRPEGSELNDDIVGDGAPSVVEEMVGFDKLRSYEKALARLPKRQQELVIFNVEFGLDYHQIAQEVQGSPNAVRMMLSRALSTIAKDMDNES